METRFVRRKTKRIFAAAVSAVMLFASVLVSADDAETAESGKNHEFRKYHCQIAVEYYVSRGWEREKAENMLFKDIFLIVQKDKI